MAQLKFSTYGNEAQKKCFKYLLGYPDITEIGYGGAAGGGKSYTGVAWQWMMRNKYPGTRGFFGREELKRLKQTTLATYFKFCDDYQIPTQQRGVYNAQDGVIKFSNGSEILLLDLAYQPSDPMYMRFGSLELTDGYIDESAEVDEQCITIIMTRIGRQKNEEYNIPPKLLEGFNPDKGHVYRRYYKPFREGTLPEYRTFIPALATDNKKLPKSYIQQLSKADEVTKQRLLYGNFEYDNTPGRLFNYEDILNMWNNPKKGGEQYLSIDVARKGKDSTVIYRWKGFDVEEVISEPISNIASLAERIKGIIYEHAIDYRNVIADEDGVGGGLVDTLRCQGFLNNATPKQRKNPNLSTRRNFQNLKTQCYFELARHIKEISITDTSIREKLAEELDVVVQINLDSDTKTSIIAKEDIKDKLGRSPDYSDALMMRMYYELDKIEKNTEEEQETEYDPLGIFIDDDIIDDGSELDPY